MVDRLPMDFILQKPHRGVADAELLKDLQSVADLRCQNVTSKTDVKEAA